MKRRSFLATAAAGSITQLLDGQTAAKFSRITSPFYAKDGGPLGIWRQWAPRVHGQAMKGGHFFPEENPGDTAALVRNFLAA